MKDENIVLTCCLTFAFVIITGLTIQSCRAKYSAVKAKINTELQQTSSITEDSSYSKKGSQTAISSNDSLFVRKFIERMQQQWTFSKEYFQPMKDVSGNIIGSFLASREQILLTDNKEKHTEEKSRVISDKKDSLEYEDIGISQSKRNDSIANKDKSVINSKSKMSNRTQVIVALITILLSLITAFLISKKLHR